MSAWSGRSRLILYPRRRGRRGERRMRLEDAGGTILFPAPFTYLLLAAGKDPSFTQRRSKTPVSLLRT